MNFQLPLCPTHMQQQQKMLLNCSQYYPRLGILCKYQCIIFFNSFMTEVLIEWAKLRASRVFVPYVPHVPTCFTYSRALCACVPSCLCSVRAFIFLHALCAFILLRAVHAFIFLDAFHAFIFKRALRALVLYVPCVPSFSYMPSFVCVSYVPSFFVVLTFYLCICKENQLMNLPMIVHFCYY